jgi:hypothetical protein
VGSIACSLWDLAPDVVRALSYYDADAKLSGDSSSHEKPIKNESPWLSGRWRGLEILEHTTNA